MISVVGFHSNSPVKFGTPGLVSMTGKKLPTPGSFFYISVPVENIGMFDYIEFKIEKIHCRLAWRYHMQHLLYHC